jgi:hypothetical protein
MKTAVLMAFGLLALIPGAMAESVLLDLGTDEYASTGGDCDWRVQHCCGEHFDTNYGAVDVFCEEPGGGCTVWGSGVFRPVTARCWV